MSQTEIKTLEHSHPHAVINQSPQEGIVRPHHMHALSGIRFFAIFNIFLFHLWIVHWLEFPPPHDLIFIDFVRFPEYMKRYFSHGWMATSLFFLLSGFMLGYLYWGKDGQLSMKPKRFLILRLSRIYPIHVIVLLLLVMLSFFGISENLNRPISERILGGITTLTLTQAWFPPLVPVWSWPSWNLSAIVFLYAITPWLMPLLARLSLNRMKLLLAALPFISLIPTTIFALMRTQGFEWTQNTNIFLSSTPLFWVPHFIAGMLLSRVFNITRYNPPVITKRRWISFGDVCMAVALFLAFSDLVSSFDERNFFRHGLMMPLYLMVILDLARGQGLTSRFFSLPGMNFLGEAGFSVFVWQTFFMVLSFHVLRLEPALALGQLWWVCGAMIVVAIASTYLIEKPLQRVVRRWFLVHKHPPK